MSKPTFLHTVGGRTFKRQSARAYTHVVLARANIDKSVAYIEQLRAGTLAQAERSARDYFAHFSAARAVGLGGRVPYMKGQGGYGRAEGQVVREWDLSYGAECFAARGETVEAWVQHARAESLADIEASLKRAREQSTDWYVLSWHHSAALAEKAANTARGVRDVKVEAINGGVQS